MSRCFPFPPPGYVRKAGVESAASVVLLKQDKHREKKDKKAKDREKEKDREKREGKERKQKDRSDEKHRDKKEKKDIRKDKKDKNKEKEREKDRSSSSNDKKLALHTGGTNEEMTPKEKGPLPSLLPVGQAGDRSFRKEKERGKHRNSTPGGKKPAGQKVEKIIPTNNNSSRDIGDNNKFVQELEKRVRNDRSSGTQLAEKFIVVEKKKDEGIVRFSVKPTASFRPDGKEWNKERRDNEQKVERANGTLEVQNFGGAVQSRVKEVRTPLEQNIEMDIECREKFKGKEGDDKWADKWKEKDGEKRDQGKVELDKEREEGEMREKSERTRHIDQEKLKLSRKNDLLSSLTTKNLQQPVKEPDKNGAGFGSVIKKRKEPETNGFLHANEIQASKLPKQTLASHSPKENGRMLEPYCTPAPVAPPWSGPTNNSNNILKANEEDRKINGVMETQPMPPVSPPVNIQSSTSRANSLLAKVPLRPPHPDSEHLEEILSRVPRMEELPELDDDQGWLFDINREDSNKSKRGHMVIDEMPRVWGESLHIESADIYALPYVIPY